METQAIFPSTDRFSARHLGPGEADVSKMLTTVGVSSLESLVAQTVPDAIRMGAALSFPGLPREGRSEAEVLDELRAIANENRVYRTYLGMGYSGTVTPPVILRNILENPGWYTQYTPYQAEIAQGRLEALLNFQTMVGDLTGLPVAGASLLDEGTAAAEAMAMAWAIRGKAEAPSVFVSERCHPQTIAVLKTRADALKIRVIVGDHVSFDFAKDPVFAVLVQYPASDGDVLDYSGFFARAHEHSAMTICAADLLSLTLLQPPGEFGADIAVGTTQRFGVPMGFGGPHAAFLSTRDEFKRQMPGRIVGLSKDASGRPAARLALQTREQHIRRDKATSNICTAQVLLAVVASMYAVYHGPRGLKAIAERVHSMTTTLRAHLKELGYDVKTSEFFDTLRMGTRKGAALQAAFHQHEINIRLFENGDVGVSLDETVGDAELLALLKVFAAHADQPAITALKKDPKPRLGRVRDSAFLGHPVFNSYHSETELLRYMNRLQSKDLSLTHSMIPLGSCTMKLNATAEMIPVTWPHFGAIHPFAPSDQTRGYQRLIQKLESRLSEITGFAATSLQPNAGSQGEYAGLLVIKAYQESRGQGHRDVCLIPLSAHGTNPASAVMAGYRVVGVKTDSQGNIDVADLRTRAEEHAENLAALMITYPSTHGVFEESVKEICGVIHQHGGQVYMDGANMNAQVGLCRPGDMGADVCHLNLHKTFCIPHGGGGPGMGPICVAPQLAPFLPGHPIVAMGGAKAIGPISAAPWGSPSILPISFAYIEMMGAEGLKRATQIAILNANYLAERLHPHFPVLYRGTQGRVAHECILDLRSFKASAGVEAEDVAKRLMDYGFHAPTLSWPVTGTLMIEPTESESLAELNRFADALIAIRQEIREIEEGRADRLKNVLKLAPHTAEQVSADTWDRPYSRQSAAYPLPWVRERKFWPSVGRIDNVYGDRNLVCTCAPMEDYLT